jgi:catechol 2,3-dioxygenase-like lactoylglutathione lyase family enzyme
MIPITVTEVRLKLYPVDFGRARDFYEHFLGFPMVHEWDTDKDDQGVMFRVGPVILELLAAKSSEPIQGVDVSLEIADVRKLWDKLKSYPKISHALRDNSWGDTSFALLDPEGFRITFFTKNDVA